MRKTAVLAFAVVSLLPVYADAVTVTVRDTREFWRIGFGVFDVDGAASEFAFLGRSVPLLLRERLSEIDAHTITPAERRTYARSLVDAEIVREGRRLTDAVQRRDGAYFGTGDEAARERTRLAAREDIRAARERIALLEEMSLDDVEIPSTKPIRMVQGESGLLPAVVFPERTSREHDLDLIVFGTIEMLGEYVFVDATAYSTLAGKVVASEYDVVLPTEIEDAVADIADRLADFVAGRDWGDIVVRTGDRSVRVFLNDRHVGYGDTTVRFLETGLHTVRIVHHGAPAVVRTVTLDHREQLVLDLEYPTVVTEPVTIESIPPGASVYQNAVYVGVTPIAIPTPWKVDHIRLTNEGYRDSQFLLTPDSPATVSRALTIDDFDAEQRLTDRRNAFYRSLGHFVLSVPVPIVLFGVYRDYLTVFSATEGSSTISGREDIARTGLTAYYGGWVSVGLSGALLFRAVRDLVRYISVGEAYHFE